ncbi:guanylate-binding protein 5 isoform X2 [Camelus bactrianus]|uniref:Guanylate-binding protein 5-like isoform X1 n=2 Tax=Camelus bactrianus TaxID=9837 RepID=A0A9W3HFF2_CAMBA|nr:guanylate-binding protein 5-like isoform X1 [Camelus bactrianus]XP_045369103.1 guanylate-binding protein 5-like isoform X1 [Camelus bactrianus]
MAPVIHMPEPLCLVKNTNGRLVANPKALTILSAITQPVVVVAIVGLCRTGKSYLMNRLAGKSKGFSIRSTVQPHTKGIWMWCVPHPKKPDHTLVLLDTEGLGDVEKGDKKNDTQIFVLALLLSSTFVYNTMNKIDQRDIDLLHYVTELSGLLRTVSSPDLDGIEDAADFVSICPDLVWTLRDFYLDLEAHGQLITADEYLENSLRPKQGTDQGLQNFNLPRLCIQKFFTVKKCFIFYLPTLRKKLAQLETLRDDDLDPEFVQQVADFCSYIFSHSNAKTLLGGIKVNGSRLESLVLTYVNAISSGDLPCMEDAVLALAEIKNLAAVQKAIAHYDQQMFQKVQLPTETLQELQDLHRASEREAIEVFMKNSFKDVDQGFQKKLETLLEARQDDFHKRNSEASLDRCSALLQDIFHPLEGDVKRGIYLTAGGHRLYVQKTEELKAKYYQEPRKGIQAEEALQKYLQSKESVRDRILQTDLALIEREKEMEEAHVKAEVLKAEEQRMWVAVLRQYQQMMEQRQRILQEQVRQMERNRMFQHPLQQRALDLRHHCQILWKITEELEICMKINEFLRVAEKTLAEEKAKRESSEKEKKLHEQKVKKLLKKCENLTRAFMEFKAKMTEEIRVRESLLKEMNERIKMLKGDKKNDTQIFVLALLLSSTFVYNTMNKIDQRDIDLLHYVTELSGLLRTVSSPDLDGIEDAADFVSICPDLVWTLRDFYLDLEAHGQLITADEYLENSLRPKQGHVQDPIPGVYSYTSPTVPLNSKWTPTRVMSITTLADLGLASGQHSRDQVHTDRSQMSSGTTRRHHHGNKSR